jgi:transglutaminase-like putative cysteine protease
MRIRIGYDVVFACPVETPMLLQLKVHTSRLGDLEHPDLITTEPGVPVSDYIDGFGNRVSRLVAPAGQLRITTDSVVRDSGLPDEYAPHAIQHPVQDLPEDTLVHLLGSRYCETDRLSGIAWSLFGNTPLGWARVQAICDFVHNQITFSYPNARNTRTAFEGYQERIGVCRDFAHLAVAFCRCMNIPARYCTGYLGDIGVPYDPNPMDFSAWFEAYLGGRWYTFDARHNRPRIGRILMGRGRDASDVALNTSFGLHFLQSFKVWTDELKE